MSVRLWVGNYWGQVVAELEADIGPISWRLNEVGKMTFRLAKTDPRLAAQNVAFGNLVVAQFENGMPAWGGIIDPPRDWSEEAVTVTAYSAEYILGTRQTDEGRYFSQSTAGAIYWAILREAAARYPLPVVTGSIWGPDDVHSPEYHFKSLLDICQDSLTGRLSTSDFDLVPVVEGGIISFTANFYSRKGSDKPNVSLIEGHNLTDIRLREQGPIVNAWDLAGEGQSWDADVRLLSHAEDLDSITAYGLRQGSKIFGDVKLQATLDAHADNLLAESKDPHNMLDLVAVDKAPALFADYDVGDSVKVMLSSYGFGGGQFGMESMVRVLGREYDPRTETCKLVVREVVA